MYQVLAESMKESLKQNKNVILDAGYFFQWQRKLIYEELKNFEVDLIIIRVLCSDEDEIKRRLIKRKKEFDNSPLNETPSWNAYISSKQVMQPVHQRELIPEMSATIINYDTLTKMIEVTYGAKDSFNTKKIIEALENDGNNSGR